LTENTIDAEPADTAIVDVQAAPVAEAVDAAEGGDDRSAGREAAKWRKQLRDTEAQLAATNDRLAALQRNEVLRLAAEHLADGADIFRDGLDVSALLDGDGHLDHAKVVEAAQATLAAHPHWSPRPPVVKRNPASVGAGLRSGATGTDHRPGVSWAGLLNTRAGSD
jgi:hypothetical protein